MALPMAPPMAPPMAIEVRVVHRTRERLRLRIPAKRKDIPYFLGLYEDLRRLPGIRELTINPVTGSVLLQFAQTADGAVLGSLERMGLLDPAARAAADGGPQSPSLGGPEDLFAGDQDGLGGLSGLLVALAIGLAVPSERRAVLLAPALLWSLFQLVGSLVERTDGIAAFARAPSVPGPT